MSLITLLILITSIALVLTLVMTNILKVSKSVFLTFLLNFSGTFFIISGIVKLVDPLGTSYKMKDYFVELESAFAGSTMLSFVAPIFPFMSDYTVSFGMIMIVLEIVLGIWLIVGYKPKLTAWLFFLIVIFFTVLTGFTFLTGYVGEGINFFDFGNWGEYAKSNMKVTDCGCFGDFIKLEPRTTFFKDIFLIFPALYFLFNSSKFHKIGSVSFGHIVSFVSIIALTLYGMSNYKWDIPGVDFRPFSIGTDIPSVREAEEKALQGIQILGYTMKNENTGVVETILGSYEKAREHHSKSEGWIVKDQVKTEPSMKTTKISEFDFYDENDEDVTSLLLDDENQSFYIVAYELHVDSYADAIRQVKVSNEVIQFDTLSIKPLEIKIDTLNVESIVDESYTKYEFNKEYIDSYKEKIKSLIADSKLNGNNVYMFIGKAGRDKMNQFAEVVGLDIPMYEKDEILLKTVVRSNPGVVLMKKGVIKMKWHINKLPEFSKIKSEFFK